MTLPWFSTQAWASSRPSSPLATPTWSRLWWLCHPSSTCAARAWVRQVALGTYQLATVTAQTSRSTEEGLVQREPTGTCANLTTTRRMVRNGSNRNPSLIAPSKSAVLTSKRRSADVRCRNLRSRFILCLSTSRAAANSRYLNFLFRYKCIRTCYRVSRKWQGVIFLCPFAPKGQPVFAANPTQAILEPSGDRQALDGTR